MDYRFRTTPFRHQEVGFAISRDREGFALFMDMGLGKSKVALDTAAWLFGRGEVNALLVVAPKGVYASWVNDQIPTHLPEYVLERATVVKWQPNWTQAFVAKLKSLFKPDPMSLHVLVMNIEALNTQKGYDVAEKFLRSHQAMFVCDESTSIKNPQAKWTKRMLRLAKLAKYRRILTGTPITQSPLDAYSQFAFLGEDLLGFGSYYAFRNRYAILRRRRVNSHSFDEVVGYQRLPELQQKLMRHAYKVTKEEALDLPAKTYLRREVELSDNQRRTYEQLRAASIASLEETGELVTAELALTKLLRLHQVVCGFVNVEEEDEDGDRGRDLDPHGGPRLAELMSCVEELDGKVIIWARYVRNLLQICNALRDEYGPESAAIYAGLTDQLTREQIVKKFQDPEDKLRFFVGQPRTGGFGLTLTQARHVVYFANDYSLETRLQSEDRAHRIGQHFPVTYVDLVAPKTVDDKILQCLRDKNDVRQLVMGGQWRQLFDE